MEKIVIVGGGSFIKNLIGYLDAMQKYEIIGYTDIEDHGPILDLKYLGNDDQLVKLHAEGVKNACIAIGNRLNNTVVKQKVSLKLKKIGFNLPPIIGRNVIIHKGVTLGEGCIIRDAAIIQPDCSIGDFAMIGDGAVISHDTIVGDFSQIVTGCIVGRGCTLGKSVFVGFNSVITNDLTIEDNCIIGAKSLVNKDCTISGKYFGIPASLKTTL